MLIKVKNHKVYDMPTLFRMALKKIYEPKNLTTMEFDLLMSSIIDWTNHLQLRAEIGFNAVDEENQISLEYIGNMLNQDEQGKYERRKALFAEKQVDYKKFHRLPEAYKPEDFIKAREEHAKLPKEEQ